MRLLPIREHMSFSGGVAEMKADCFIESEQSQVQKLTKEEIVTVQKNELAEALHDPNYQVFIFENNNELVGFAEVNLEEKCFPDEDLPEVCMRVLTFYIDPKFRHRHLGSTVFKLLKQWGHEKEASLIEIEVDNDSYSNQFVSKQGLELVGSGVRNIYRAFI